MKAKNLLFNILSMFCLCFSVTSCGHTHQWIEIERTEATCTKEGSIAFVCAECGENNNVAINAKGHTEVIQPAIEATCTARGKTEGKYCSTCNEVLVARQTVDALGHDVFVTEAKDATCTETGLTEAKHCTVCNTVLVKQEEIPALGHENSYICGRCGQINESYYTDELYFKLSSDEQSYSVSGLKSSFSTGNVVIPSVYNNKPVTSIGSSAFYNKTTIKSIIIPDSVISIDGHAFWGCSSLTNIIIPIGVTSIGEWTFNNCASLESITIPVGVTSIGWAAFYQCGSLTTVYYAGTEEQWNSITIDRSNDYLTNANIVYNYEG